MSILSSMLFGAFCLFLVLFWFRTCTWSIMCAGFMDDCGVTIALATSFSKEVRISLLSAVTKRWWFGSYSYNWFSTILDTRKASASHFTANNHLLMLVMSCIGRRALWICCTVVLVSLCVAWAHYLWYS